VDVYLLHFPTPPVSLETWADALADAVQAGLTRTVGISNCSGEQTRRAHAALSARGVSLAVSEAEYSLLKRAS
jgi:aryl-alcohol dehydrogenase-like predicted oxidoreductase